MNFPASAAAFTACAVRSACAAFASICSATLCGSTCSGASIRPLSFTVSTTTTVVSLAASFVPVRYISHSPAVRFSASSSVMQSSPSSSMSYTVSPLRKCAQRV